MSEPRKFKASAAVRAADTRRLRRMRQLKAYGQWHPWIDAQVVRDHIAKQQAAGLGIARIATLSGVPQKTISRILYGRPSQNQPPSTRTVREIGEKILAVQATFDNIADGARIDSTGTARRIGAMVVAGRTLREIAERLGAEESNLGRILRRPLVRADTARAVHQLYREWAFTMPPQDTERQRQNYKRARALARKRGWMGAFAWENIDDPTEKPKHRVGAKAKREFDEIAVQELMDGRPVQAHFLDKREAARRLLDRGVGPNLIAERCHMALRDVTVLLAQPEQEEDEQVDDAA